MDVKKRVKLHVTQNQQQSEGRRRGAGQPALEGRSGIASTRQVLAGRERRFTVPCRLSSRNSNRRAAGKTTQLEAPLGMCEAPSHIPDTSTARHATPDTLPSAPLRKFPSGLPEPLSKSGGAGREAVKGH
ncbi:hypothetical protein E2C01_043195 [Portunus trituberculatus]|uniref:Uncharacterized protein n=1 Tax=Portunus trituberculatus TaxID=210409 RepID=A0A5B7FVN2_PORTR|nr:hypothetical protein [Portunus trituberculatus]